MIKIKTFLENNWDDIKGDVKTQWNKLNRQDINEIEGSYDSLITKLKKAYGYTKKQVEDELHEFFSSDAMQEIMENVKNIKNDAEEKTETLKESIETYLHDHLESIKDKTNSLTENIKSYSKANPIKILGAVATVSFMLSKILSSNKSE
jgi:uncharacterized protein YjbJ (UPF0337 family)